MITVWSFTPRKAGDLSVVWCFVLSLAAGVFVVTLLRLSVVIVIVDIRSTQFSYLAAVVSLFRRGIVREYLSSRTIR